MEDQNMEHSLPIKLKLPDDFLEAEERCGFQISADMKAVWAVQLDLLERFKEVCQRYGLKYFASDGTLLGAVRHKGYIPWDDDIDVIMLREDYDRLNELAEKEFTYPYFFQTIYTDPLRIRCHAQLRNSATTGYIEEDRKLPVNKGIFIDIFVLDVVPDDPVRLFFLVFRLRALFTLMTYKRFSKEEPRVFLGRLFGTFIRDVFFKKVDISTVYKYYERLCRKYYKSKNQRVTSLVFFRFRSHKITFRKKWFEGAHTVPFEFTDIVIPDRYDPVLRQQYGDYMTMRREPTIHGKLTLDPYRAFTESDTV